MTYTEYVRGVRVFALGRGFFDTVSRVAETIPLLTSGLGEWP